MGVDQTPRGLEVSVAEWTDTGARTPVLEGVVAGWSEAVQTVLTLAELFAVKRALVDPQPDAKLAQTLTAVNPAVFAFHAGTDHNAASLAEVAWRRMQVDMVAAPEHIESEMHVVSLGPDLLDDTRVLVRVYVPPGVEAPDRVVVPLANAEHFVRVDDARYVEKVLPLSEIIVE